MDPMARWQFCAQWVAGALLSVAMVTATHAQSQGERRKQESTVTAGATAVPNDWDVLVAGAKAGSAAVAQGALGNYYDPLTAEQVIVLPADRPIPDVRAVARAVGTAVRVKQLPITKAIAQLIERNVLERSFHPDAAKYSYATYFDLRKGKVIVVTDAPASVRKGLAEKYPDLIEWQTGRYQELSRQFDVQKFYGGAAIKSGNPDPICTAGFTMVNGYSGWGANGQRKMVTARHCFPGLGTYVNTNGGSEPFGYVYEFLGNYDVVGLRLLPNDYTGQTYAAKIYVGGQESTISRPVYGGANPLIGWNQYCYSGQTTGEACGFTVTTLSLAAVVWNGAARFNLMGFQGANGAAPGDSGAPFYVYSVEFSGVHIRGLLTGMIVIEGSPPIMVGEPYWNVRVAIPGTLLCSQNPTEPCWPPPPGQ